MTGHVLLPHVSIGHLLIFWLVLLFVLAAVGRAAWWAWVPLRRLPGHRVRHHRIRVRLGLHPGRGHATAVELWWRWGRWAVFRRAAHTRPGLSFWQRVAAGTPACSIQVGHGHYRHGLRISLEEHLVVMAPPRSGKSGWLGRTILHYPGPALSTSTKADVFELTSGVRAVLGPVEVFNPQAIGNVPSTFAWNIVAGCRVQSTAIRRADGFARAVSQKGVEDASFWASKASDYLRAAFCAADLLGGDLRMVSRWMIGGDARQAEQALTVYGYHDWAGLLAELRGPANKTVATVRMTLSRALAFMADPQLAAAVLPGGRGFHIEDFLGSCGTLYMIAEGTDEESPLAPLFACLTTEIHYTAALLGSRAPGRRLDPPLLMALDEVTQICPVPLPHWMADSGGKGIQVIAVVHGEAQLRSRWQADGARVIMDTAGVKMWLPGITDTTTLDDASKLAGQAAFKEHGHEGHSRHAVLDPEMIARLPERHALVIRSGLAPVIACLPMVWRDRAYRRARRRGAAVAMVHAAETWSLPAGPAYEQATSSAQGKQAGADWVPAEVPREWFQPRPAQPQIPQQPHSGTTDEASATAYPWDAQ